MKLEVLAISPTAVLFQGQVKSILLPGEQGVFELTVFHKDITSRLLTGVIFLDDRPLRIRKGVVTAGSNRVTIICEPQ